MAFVESLAQTFLLDRCGGSGNVLHTPSSLCQSDTVYLRKLHRASHIGSRTKGESLGDDSVRRCCNTLFSIDLLGLVVLCLSDASNDEGKFSEARPTLLLSPLWLSADLGLHTDTLEGFLSL